MSKAKSLLTVCVVLLALPMLAFGQKASKVPTIIALSPNTKTAGAGSLTITVTGSNFTSGTSLQWNGTSLSTTYISSNQLQGAVDGALIASAGTAKVTASTSGRWGGTSNTLSFTITAPATTTTTTTTTTTSTSPLSVTTSSIPSGSAGTSFNASVAASGGTPSYVWSLPSGSALPPGLILASTGTLTGTPTTAGTYSFTVQAADSSSSKQTAQKVFSMSVAAPTTTTTTTTTSSSNYFQSDFESGSVTLPYSSTQVSVTDSAISPFYVDTDSRLVHGGKYSGQIHYNCIGTYCDVNHGFNVWVGGTSPVSGPANGLTQWSIRWYLYLKHPETGATVNGFQRKLLYVWDKPTVPNDWDIILKGEVNGNNDVPILLSIQNAPIGGLTSNYYLNYFNGVDGYYHLQFDTWYAVEVQVTNDTSSGVTWTGSAWSGPCNGTMKLFINGTEVSSKGYIGPGNQVVSSNSVCLNLGTNYGMQFWILGQQADYVASTPVTIDEYRYIDDVVLSSGYVGP